jgi:precorrin-6B methylase 2
VTRRKPSALHSWFASAFVQRIVNLARDTGDGRPIDESAEPVIGRSETRIQWLRFLPVLLLLSLGYFVVGTRLLVTRPAPLTHPLTGRVIPGMATDTTWLDRAERDREETPDWALELIGITPGATVADVGAGTGYMTLRIARLVGPTGKVYANDVQPAMLHAIQAKIRQAQLGNVEIVQGTGDDARLPANVVDLALLVDVYHELRQPRAMLQSIRRSLRPNGRLVLVEYRKEDPRIPIASTHRMSIAEARAEIEAEGFTFDRVVEGLPRQHIIVFRRPVVQ